MTEEPIKVFFSYSHRDEEFKDELVKHLSILRRQGVISEWHDRMIKPGSDWNQEIDDHLSGADIILLLVSPDFLHSDYCWGVEVQKSMQRDAAGEACVIPVVVRRVAWQGAPFAKLQALPKNAEPIASWSNRDDAFYDVVQGINAAIADLRKARKQRQEAERQAQERARLEAEQQRQQEEERQAQERARVEAEERRQQEAAERQSRQEAERQALEKARLEADQRQRQEAERQVELRRQAEEKARVETAARQERLRQKTEVKAGRSTTERKLRGKPLLVGGAAVVVLGTFYGITQISPRQQTATSPQTAEEFYQRGYGKWLKDDNSGAIADYDQALKLNPNYGKAYEGRCASRVFLEDKEALADCTQAIKFYPENARLYFLRSTAQSTTEEQIADITKAINLEQSNGLYYYTRGALHSRAGNKSGAIADYQKAAELFQQERDSEWQQRALDQLKKLQQ